ncbi:amino acid ABC transporter permease [Cypionkella psychrotolerans]|uniref:amino acid ABC transporter permease n=1 Tax=Cypionkella psychrotolerans TaxID=1678131 RepID=UPI0006B5B7D2|nr:amino acid ABC transporter permease [Cypionkella psychrotolerans]
MGYEFDFSAISENIGLLLHGAGLTIGLTAIAATVGMALSIGGAAAALWGPGWLRRIVGVYVELIRNTPFIVQLFFIFFGLPSLGVKLTAFEAAALAMTINLTAYGIEIVRAGIEAVPPGQREAGFALGIAPISTFIYIVLPQAIAVVYPALVSQIVITMLESAVVSQVAVTDLTHAADLIQSRTYRAFETYFAVTLIYLGMALLMRWLFNRAGRQLFAGKR